MDSQNALQGPLEGGDWLVSSCLEMLELMAHLGCSFVLLGNNNEKWAPAKIANHLPLAFCVKR